MLLRGSGDEGRRKEGSTVGRFGFGEKCVAWDAMCAAMSPADSGRFKRIEGIRGRVAGLVAAAAVVVLLVLVTELLLLLLLVLGVPVVLIGV